MNGSRNLILWPTILYARSVTTGAEIECFVLRKQAAASASLVGTSTWFVSSSNFCIWSIVHRQFKLQFFREGSFHLDIYCHERFKPTRVQPDPFIY